MPQGDDIDHRRAMMDSSWSRMAVQWKWRMPALRHPHVSRSDAATWERDRI